MLRSRISRRRADSAPRPSVACGRGGFGPGCRAVPVLLGALSGPRRMAIPRRDVSLVIRDLRLRPRFLWWRRRRPAWLAQLRGGDEDMVCVGLARDVPSILDSDPVDGR